MGLIKAAIGAVGGVLADQWKEFFYCESIQNDILMVKGQKVIGKRSSNTKASDNIISNGSGIAVADGQCMMIVEQGKIVEFCAEPGEYTFDSSTEPSIFSGGLGEGIKKAFGEVGRRFAYGGDTGKDQRVYYFNLKEIMDNKFGTQNPVPFRVVDRNIGLDIDISIKCNGVYSYKMTNPILFYKNIAGNVSDKYSKSDMDSQLKSEFLTALQPAFARISAMGIRYSELPGKTEELTKSLNAELTEKWSENRGISIVSVGINSMLTSKEDEDLIKQLQKTAVMKDMSMAGASLVSAQSDAMRAAAQNSAGAMTGFMGMGMAMQTGNINAQNLYQMGQEQKQNSNTIQQAQSSSNNWICGCGTENTGKFCTQCASPKPTNNGWICKCGATNTGKFCSECGSAKPSGVKIYKCDKCGWQVENPNQTPKFCPECGDIFNENDIIQN